MNVRPIVKAAFKVDELYEQFVNIDVPDGLLIDGTPEEVNAKYSDAQIVGEAFHRLSLVQDQLNNIGDYDCEDRKILTKDKRQLNKFILKFG